MHKLIMVRLLTKMKMWRDRVLEEMDDEIAKQNQQGGRFSPYFQALRNHLDQRGAEHESRADRNEVAKVSPLPVALHNNGAAKDIGRSRRQAQENARGDRVHFSPGSYQF